PSSRLATAWRFTSSNSSRSRFSMWCRNPDCGVDDEKICSSAVVTTAARSKMKPEEREVAMADLSDHFCDGISPTCQSWTMPVNLAGQAGVEPDESRVFQGRGSPTPCRCPQTKRGP